MTSSKELYILTGMETFVKELELTTILCRRNKIKFAGFCSMSLLLTPGLMRLGALLRDHLQMGAFSKHRCMFLLDCIDQ